MIIQASNLSLTEGQNSTRLIADSAAASGTISVYNISGFAVGKYILIGEFGEPSAEIIRIHAATAPTGNTITLASNTTLDHYTDTKVTLIDFNQVEFNRSVTLTGTKSVLDTVAISADRDNTAYNDGSYSTGYAFFRFKNSATSVYSDYSSGISYSGIDNSSVQSIVEKACDDTFVEIGGEYSTEKMLLNDANDCQDAITDYDWKFELVKDSTLSVTKYTNSVDLDSLTYAMKYPGISQGVKTVKFGANDLQYVDNDEMDAYYKDTPQTTLSADALAGATSVTLTDSHEFDTVGTVYINGLALTYTANDTSTGILSGISASSITSTLSSGSVVWQNINSGLPTKYTITIDNNLIFNCPVDTLYDGYHITIEYLKKLTRFTDFASVTEIPFVDNMPSFISAKIERRKRNFDNYDKFMKDFDDAVMTKLLVYKLPILENSKYYNFFDSGDTTVYREHINQ